MSGSLPPGVIEALLRFDDLHTQLGALCRLPPPCRASPPCLPAAATPTLACFPRCPPPQLALCAASSARAWPTPSCCSSASAWQGGGMAEACWWLRAAAAAGAQSCLATCLAGHGHQAHASRNLLYKLITCVRISAPLPGTAAPASMTWRCRRSCAPPSCGACSWCVERLAGAVWLASSASIRSLCFSKQPLPRSCCTAPAGDAYSRCLQVAGAASRRRAGTLPVLVILTAYCTSHRAPPPPPLPASCLQGLSSNTRYQVVFGLERLVDEVRRGHGGMNGYGGHLLLPLLLPRHTHTQCVPLLPCMVAAAAAAAASASANSIAQAPLLKPGRPPQPLRQTIARRIPAAAYFTTLVIRFANNVVGGENFIDMARWAGVQ